MNTISKSLFSGMLALMSFTASAQISIAPLERGIADVLVKVSDDGSIRDFSIAEQFPPKLKRLLENTVKGLIVTPSATAPSKRVGQVVLRFYLKPTARPDGNYDVQFVAFDSKPVPSGSWFWATYDQRQLALVDRNKFQNGRSSLRQMDGPTSNSPASSRHSNTSQSTGKTASLKKS